jgi:hypothetical protein
MHAAGKEWGWGRETGTSHPHLPLHHMAVPGSSRPADVSLLGSCHFLREIHPVTLAAYINMEIRAA